MDVNPVAPDEVGALESFVVIFTTITAVKSKKTVNPISGSQNRLRGSASHLLEAAGEKIWRGKSIIAKN